MVNVRGANSTYPYPPVLTSKHLYTMNNVQYTYAFYLFIASGVALFIASEVVQNIFSFHMGAL